jgi:hypothetical protein
MVTLPMQALLVTMLFYIIHPKYHFMKRRHSRTLATKLQATYEEVQCPHSVKKLTMIFYLQISTTNHIYVGLDESPTNICQLHFSKNSFIKPHVDSLDMESSIIRWFITRAPLKGRCALHQYLYKF